MCRSGYVVGSASRRRASSVRAGQGAWWRKARQGEPVLPPYLAVRADGPVTIGYAVTSPRGSSPAPLALAAPDGGNRSVN
jgi:hypothetical protein